MPYMLQSIQGKNSYVATLLGQSLEQPSERPQKVHVLQPPVLRHSRQQSAALNTRFWGCWEFTSMTMVSPSTFCCSAYVNHPTRGIIVSSRPAHQLRLSSMTQPVGARVQYLQAM